MGLKKTWGFPLTSHHSYLHLSDISFWMHIFSTIHNNHNLIHPVTIKYVNFTIVVAWLSFPLLLRCGNYTLQADVNMITKWEWQSNNEMVQFTFFFAMLGTRDVHWERISSIESDKQLRLRSPWNMPQEKGPNVKLKVQGSAERIYQGCVNMTWNQCARPQHLLQAGRHKFSPSLTQPGKSLLVEPCKCYSLYLPPILLGP